MTIKHDFSFADRSNTPLSWEDLLTSLDCTDTKIAIWAIGSQEIFKWTACSEAGNWSLLSAGFSAAVKASESWAAKTDLLLITASDARTPFQVLDSLLNKQRNLEDLTHEYPDIAFVYKDSTSPNSVYGIGNTDLIENAISELQAALAAHLDEDSEEQAAYEDPALYGQESARCDQHWMQWAQYAAELDIFPESTIERGVKAVLAEIVDRLDFKHASQDHSPVTGSSVTYYPLNLSTLAAGLVESQWPIKKTYTIKNETEAISALLDLKTLLTTSSFTLAQRHSELIFSPNHPCSENLYLPHANAANSRTASAELAFTLDPSTRINEWLELSVNELVFDQAMLCVLTKPFLKFSEIDFPALSEIGDPVANLAAAVKPPEEIMLGMKPDANNWQLWIIDCNKIRVLVLPEKTIPAAPDAVTPDDAGRFYGEIDPFAPPTETEYQELEAFLLSPIIASGSDIPTVESDVTTSGGNSATASPTVGNGFQLPENMQCISRITHRIAHTATYPLDHSIGYFSHPGRLTAAAAEAALAEVAADLGAAEIIAPTSAKEDLVEFLSAQRLALIKGAADAQILARRNGRYYFWVFENGRIKQCYPVRLTAPVQ